MQERGGSFGTAAGLRTDLRSNKSCSPLPARDDLEHNAKKKGWNLNRRSSHFVWGSQARRRCQQANTALPEESSHTLHLATGSSPLLYFLLNIFRNYSDFFCPFIPPSDRASWRWKQLKIMINHKENSSFSRSTVPNSEQTQQPRGTRDISKYSKYSMGRLGCANILHVGNSQ